MINRLDFTYADKRLVYLIEQELSTLREGDMAMTEFYDEVEKKLTLLTNKTIMTCDTTLAINEKYRSDACIHKGNIKVFERDLPTALALAQEVESNHERYQFALNYSRSLGEGQKAEKKQTDRDWHTNVHQ